MGAQSSSQPEGWTIAGAERLLTALTGVVSARIVAKAGGEIQEIHLLTTEELGPKQTVRNVESALLSHFDLEVDHRKISVAQTKASVLPLREPAEAIAGVPAGAQTGAVPPLRALETQPAETRLLFAGHETLAERAHRVRMRVSLQWRGETYQGEATGTDLPRSRPEIVAEATLRAIEAAVNGPDAEPATPGGVSLALDGVKTIDAFDRHYMMVGVHAITPRKLTVLAGVCPLEDSPDRAAILATLQATDRWVRGRAAS